MRHAVGAGAIKVVAAAEAVVVAMAAAMEEAVTMAASMTTVATTATVAATAAIKAASMEEATAAAVATTLGATAQLREEEEDVDAVVASPRARSAVSMVTTPSAVILASTTPFSRRLPTGKPPTPTPPPTPTTMATTGYWTPVRRTT
jgi:hypothetical protein